MNKELKIFGVVAIFTLVLYWGVEPFAHSQMHKHVEGHGLKYDGTADIAAASKEKVEAKKAFWGDVKKIAALKGDAAAGAAGYAMCQGCHMEGAANMGGAIPPVLDHAGSIYDKDYLIALIKDPAMAMNTDHKFADTMMHPMGSIKTMVTEDQAIADTVAYIKANLSAEATPKEAYIEACGRCHANRYGGLTQLGETPKFKYKKDELAHQIKVLEEQDLVKGYMGKIPPDLSIIYRARSHHFLETLIENPQSQLAGTAMPRVGLSHDGMEKVMAYLEETGDPSEPARAALGPWVLLFLIVFTVLAYLWKSSLWRDLH